MPTMKPKLTNSKPERATRRVVEVHPPVRSPTGRRTQEDQTPFSVTDGRGIDPPQATQLQTIGRNSTLAAPCALCVLQTMLPVGVCCGNSTSDGGMRHQRR